MPQPFCSAQNFGHGEPRSLGGITKGAQEPWENEGKGTQACSFHPAFHLVLKAKLPPPWKWRCKLLHSAAVTPPPLPHTPKMRSLGHLASSCYLLHKVRGSQGGGHALSWP